MQNTGAGAVSAVFTGPQRLLGKAPLLAAALVVAVAYYLSAKVAVLTALPPEGVAIIWPANAILFAALVLVERRYWPIFIMATVAAEIFADLPAYPLFAAVAYGLANAAQAAIAAALLQLVCRQERPSLTTVRGLLAFLFTGPGAAAALTSACGAAIYVLVDPSVDYLEYWRILWMGDGIGLLILGGLFLTLRGRTFRLSMPRGGRIAELVLAWSMLASALLWVFVAPHGAMPFMLFPPLIWISLRFGPSGAALAVAITTTIAVSTAIADMGAFANYSNVERVVDLQLLIAATVISTLLIAFASDEARRAHHQLREANARLDAKVEERTRELRSALSRNQFLLSELSHRIKNNLQIVGVYVRRAMRNLPEPQAQLLLSGIDQQILAIAAVYDTIRQTGSELQTDVVPIVRVLCDRVREALKCRLDLHMDPGAEAPMEAERTVLLCVTLNELLTNAVKHGGPDPALVVTCRREADYLRIVISDNGPGFPAGFSFAGNASFGTQLVWSNIASAGGTIEARSSDDGALIDILVPLGVQSDHPPQAA